jgi:hypothetical protein
MIVIAPRNGEYLPILAEPKCSLATTNLIEMTKINEALVMCKEAFDPEKNHALVAEFRNFVNETGIGHSEIAHVLGISPGTILGWMRGTIKLRSATLVAIKSFLETKGPSYLRAAQRDNQADREQSEWHSFPQYP